MFCSALFLKSEAQPVLPDANTFTPVVSVSCSGVQDQYLSSTCWSFAGLSFIESELMRKGIHPPDLSEMYIARYSWLNKINRHLAQRGKTFLTPGGQFHDILKVIGQYGMVPEKTYNGKPQNELQYNHETIDTLLTRYTSKMVKQGKQKPGAADLAYINKVLNQYLGRVPEQFRYEDKLYTPQQFASDRLGFDTKDYIEITSYTHRPWYKPFVLEDKYNWSSDRFYNVPFEDFITITDSALFNGYTVCWDGDVTEPGFLHEQAIAWLPDTISNYRQQRQETYSTGESKIDHMMHITGISTDSAGNKWYRVKNSWGSYSNQQGGWLYMNRAFFAIKTIAIIVNKNPIPRNIKQKMGL